MQRSIIHGVPYFVDTAGKVYLYEPFVEKHTHIGNLVDGNVVPLENIKSTIESRVSAWRGGQVVRKRKPDESEEESAYAES